MDFKQQLQIEEEKLKKQKEIIDVLYKISNLLIQSEQYTIALQPEGIAYLKNAEPEQLEHIIKSFQQFITAYRANTLQFFEKADEIEKSEYLMWREDYRFLQDIISICENKILNLDAAFALLHQNTEQTASEKVVCKTDVGSVTWNDMYKTGLLGLELLQIFDDNTAYNLWKLKTKGVRISDNDVAEIQNEYALKEIYSKKYAKMSGYQFKWEKSILHSKEHPFMLSDIDGYITLPDGKECILVFDSWLDSESLNEAYEMYSLVLQHDMAVTGYQYACLLKLEIDEDGEILYCDAGLIERNEKSIELLTEIEEKFLERVQKRYGPDTWQMTLTEWTKKASDIFCENAGYNQNAI